MTVTSRSPAARVAALWTVLACLPAAAQTTMPSTSDWQYELVPYVWLPGIRSDVKLGPLPENTMAVNPRGILSALDYAAMGTFQVQNGSTRAKVAACDTHRSSACAFIPRAAA